ncbi:hypothetical protein MACH15_05120 [Maricaulis maris]|nr:hypothetical protein MACH15_05120 [Maricaulis maris]
MAEAARPAFLTARVEGGPHGQEMLRGPVRRGEGRGEDEAHGPAGRAPGSEAFIQAVANLEAAGRENVRSFVGRDAGQGRKAAVEALTFSGAFAERGIKPLKPLNDGVDHDPVSLANGNFDPYLGEIVA